MQVSRRLSIRGSTGVSELIALPDRLPPERESNYPNLRLSGYRTTSADTVGKRVRYNCVAWAATGRTVIWWEPAIGCYWPDGIEEDGSLDSYVRLFEQLKYVRCANNSRLELFYEKVALYAYPEGDFAHVAYQLYYGWTSKLGDWQDIWHRAVDGLEGDYYGKVSVMMKRRCTIRGIFARAFANLTAKFWPA